MTNGVIGKFEINGEQVGGFLDWQIEVQVANSRSRTVATSTKYWLFKLINKGIIATFYFDLDGELVIANQSPVTIQFPVIEFNRIIQAPIEMTFNETR